ncbi:MAG: hypothetical protein SGI86_17270 [Deltaproteobacteria bacterium]|nr:hypothetical protein [Deltaproteobacteria bacterium]
MSASPLPELSESLVLSDRPPRWYWSIPALVIVLRMIPFISTYLVAAPEGRRFLPVGFIPKDFLAYGAFIRQAAQGNGLTLLNPFTTDPQDGRFILVFHSILGLFVRVTGLDPLLAIELARIPLTFAFFATFWWFTRPFFRQRQERSAAALLLAFAGGIDPVLRLLAKTMPIDMRPSLSESAQLFGWSGFADMYNPLWVAGIALSLIAIRPIIVGTGPANWRQAAQVSIFWFITHWIHPYSAVVVLATAGCFPVAAIVISRPVDWKAQARTAICLAPTLAITLLFSRWQSQDMVFRTASLGFFGPQAISIFWYPLTLTVPGLLAAIGVSHWFRADRAAAFSMLTWMVVIALMHSSPFINGYHFVPYLAVPVAVLAAPTAMWLLTAWQEGRMRVRTAVAFTLAFQTAPLLTIESTLANLRRNSVDGAFIDIAAALKEMPSGNALVPPAFGNVLPALTSHRVWVGHWFLTPDYQWRAQTYGVLGRTSSAEMLTKILSTQAINYLVLPTMPTSVVPDGFNVHSIHGAWTLYLKTPVAI